MRKLLNHLLLLLFLANSLEGQVVPYEGSEHVPLSLVLKELKQHKAASFLYEPETIANIYIDTPFSYQADTKTILKEILPPVYLKFRRIGRHNFIIKKVNKRKKLSHDSTKTDLSYSLPKKTIKKVAPMCKLSGSVLDETGLPLIGATILLTKYQSGIVTDENGFFELVLPSNREQLSISYLGYKEKIINIQEEKEVIIHLKRDENLFEEVIISALGFVQKKDQLGTTSSIIQKKAIASSGEVSLLNAIR